MRVCGGVRAHPPERYGMLLSSSTTPGARDGRGEAHVGTDLRSLVQILNVPRPFLRSLPQGQLQWTGTLSFHVATAVELAGGADCHRGSLASALVSAARKVDEQAPDSRKRRHVPQ
mmetsp:Transcript_145866/g.466094  ORF Transcript_145866/g.466094 Transcript_145866/m.466094 type:complete len:116 (+) Transcript_145866:790-1137(+)